MTLRDALPYALYRHFYVTRPARLRQREEEERLRRPLELAARNAVFHDRHAGERCFILCNGPSVKRQNIRLLKDEQVFSVSSGYHHPDYGHIGPAYHCVPQLTYGRLTRADAVAWFSEMDAKLGNATLFLNYTEETLVREEGLFRGRDVRYLVLSGDFADFEPLAKLDIAKRLPGVQSVPIMSLIVAMYMRFTRIYLLGADHDHFRTGEYKYFFEPTVLRGKDASANADGKLAVSWYDELSGLVRLWGQYRALKRIAEHNGIQIVNATVGGELDEFPRVDLESLFASVEHAG